MPEDPQPRLRQQVPEPPRAAVAVGRDRHDAAHVVDPVRELGALGHLLQLVRDQAPQIVGRPPERQPQHDQQLLIGRQHQRPPILHVEDPVAAAEGDVVRRLRPLPPAIARHRDPDREVDRRHPHPRVELPRPPQRRRLGAGEDIGERLALAVDAVPRRAVEIGHAVVDAAPGVAVRPRRAVDLALTRPRPHRAGVVELTRQRAGPPPRPRAAAHLARRTLRAHEAARRGEGHAPPVDAVAVRAVPRPLARLRRRRVGRHRVGRRPVGHGAIVGRGTIEVAIGRARVADGVVIAAEQRRAHQRERDREDQRRETRAGSGHDRPPGGRPDIIPILPIGNRNAQNDVSLPGSRVSFGRVDPTTAPPHPERRPRSRPCPTRPTS